LKRVSAGGLARPSGIVRLYPPDANYGGFLVVEETTHKATDDYPDVK
jgi:hypothetical protein